MFSGIKLGCIMVAPNTKMAADINQLASIDFCGPGQIYKTFPKCVSSVKKEKKRTELNS